MKKETREKREDRRSQVTRQLLRESLIELMKKKPIEKITVTELCTKAEINRGTFYLHYDYYQAHYNKLIFHL